MRPTTLRCLRTGDVEDVARLGDVLVHLGDQGVDGVERLHAAKSLDELDPDFAVVQVDAPRLTDTLRVNDERFDPALDPA